MSNNDEDLGFFGAMTILLFFGGIFLAAVYGVLGLVIKIITGWSIPWMGFSS